MSPTGESSLPVAKPGYTKDTFVSGQEVRWCPGCGDYAILATMQRTLAKFADVPKEKYVFISGIGCSSRFPYYMNTYGFHTIHGRAPTIASGLRCVDKDLSIWVITGDGDGLSIGGNHLMHCMRRNMNLKILLVNNRIYGLTKGQYSPTSETGKLTKSTPYGSIDYPINPLCIAIASEATFIARTVDSIPNHMSAVLERAMHHKGVAFVEIYQNCLIFNDKTFEGVTGRNTREDRMIYLEHDKPLLFGQQKEKGIRLNGLVPEVVMVKDVKPSELLVHNEKDPNPHYAYMLTQMDDPETPLPVPFGVFRAIEKPTYDERMEQQIQAATKQKGPGDLKNLIYGPDTWTVA
jgi:2-oxoglutarate ferredoxin oxidoreductase subunit beta